MASTATCTRTAPTSVPVSNAALWDTCAPTAPPCEHFVNHEDLNPPLPLALSPPPSRNWEAAQSYALGGVPTGVKGRLKPCLAFGQNELQCSLFVRDVISSGYKIPFFVEPPPVFLKNNHSSLQHPQFVESAISELVKNRCILLQPTHSCGRKKAAACP